MSTPKEPRFFVEEPEPLGRWSRGVDWYRGLFVTGKRLCGEASPRYAAAPSVPGVPGRIATVLPSAKLIYLVRDPYQRLVSHYLMTCRAQQTAMSFAEFIESVPHALNCSCYGTQVAGYLDHFSRDRLLIVESESLKNDRATTMRNVFSFLGADPAFKSPLFHHQRHIGWHQPFLSPRGRWIENSRFMRKISHLLPHNVFTALKNVLLRPFSVSAPSTELPPDLKSQIDEKLLEEAQLLRRLTGLPLASLTPAGRPRSGGEVLSKDS